MSCFHLPQTFLAYCLLCIVLVAFDNFLIKEFYDDDDDDTPQLTIIRHLAET